MQFQVPQFIEVEDKIFGPLTFKQFIFIFGGIGFSYIFWRLLPIFISAPLIAGVGGLAVALAFFQLNGRPFILGLENAFYFYTRSKLYLWNNQKKKKAAPAQAQIAVTAPDRGPYIPKLSDSRLHELAWSLDIKERIASGTVADGEREEASEIARIHTPQEILAHLQNRSLAH